MTEKDDALTARVLNIQRMSTEDGPGIRTTVFFKGCGLRCAWCHNPESISAKPQVHWIETKCIGCKTCIAACPEKALIASPAGILIDRERCTGCGVCAHECPSTAMELLGTEWNLEALLDEVQKDRAYFRSSGGGVTASGGDPTMQAPFVAEFLRGCRERGMHAALDTCGSCPPQLLDRLLPHADLVLYDLKLMDPGLHEKYTGHRNSVILQNVLRVRDYMVRSGRRQELWIRTPLIPGATDTVDNIVAIGRFIADNLDEAVKKWELCAFNNLCRDKYRRLGIAWEFREAKLLSRAFLDEMAEAARSSGVDPSIVQWTGAARVEPVTGGAEEKSDTLKLVKGCGSC